MESGSTEKSTRHKKGTAMMNLWASVLAGVWVLGAQQAGCTPLMCLINRWSERSAPVRFIVTS